MKKHFEKRDAFIERVQKDASFQTLKQEVNEVINLGLMIMDMEFMKQEEHINKVWDRMKQSILYKEYSGKYCYFLELLEEYR